MRPKLITRNLQRRTRPTRSYAAKRARTMALGGPPYMCGTRAVLTLRYARLILTRIFGG